MGDIDRYIVKQEPQVSTNPDILVYHIDVIYDTATGKRFTSFKDICKELNALNRGYD